MACAETAEAGVTRRPAAPGLAGGRCMGARGGVAAPQATLPAGSPRTGAGPRRPLLPGARRACASLGLGPWGREAEPRRRERGRADPPWCCRRRPRPPAIVYTGFQSVCWERPIRTRCGSRSALEPRGPQAAWLSPCPATPGVPAQEPAVGRPPSSQHRPASRSPGAAAARSRAWRAPRRSARGPGAPGPHGHVLLAG